MRHPPPAHTDPGPVYGMKVLSAGYPKSGTTSLREACRKLGLRPMKGNAAAYNAWCRGESPVGFHDDFVGGFPFCLMVEELQAFHPDLRVVLCVREAGGWIRSVRRWMSRNVADGFKIFEGKSDEELARMYVDHNQWVREVCRVPLLEVSWEAGDGWPELCEFLGFEVPEGEFPHEMKSR